jgi:hypothetical protein
VLKVSKVPKASKEIRVLQVHKVFKVPKASKEIKV